MNSNGVSINNESFSPECNNNAFWFSVQIASCLSSGDISLFYISNFLFSFKSSNSDLAYLGFNLKEI